MVGRATVRQPQKGDFYKSAGSSISSVYDMAENRLRIQKAAMALTMAAL